MLSCDIDRRLLSATLKAVCSLKRFKRRHGIAPDSKQDEQGSLLEQDMVVLPVCMHVSAQGRDGDRHPVALRVLTSRGRAVSYQSVCEQCRHQLEYEGVLLANGLAQQAWLSGQGAVSRGVLRTAA